MNSNLLKNIDLPTWDNRHVLKAIKSNSVVNPITNISSIGISVRRYFTDVDGAIIDKAAAPAVLQTKFPVYTLGNFDRQSAWKIGSRTVPPVDGTFFVHTFVRGVNDQFLLSSGLNTVLQRIDLGSIVEIFTDSLTAPTTYVWIVQTNQIAGIASIISNTNTVQADGRTGQLHVKELGYTFDNPDQYEEIFRVVQSFNTGVANDNPLNTEFKSPLDKQNGFQIVPVDFLFDQFTGLNFYMRYATDSIVLNFKVNY